VGRWALLVFKASLHLFQPPHHHCSFLFYSGLLKFNGDRKSPHSITMRMSRGRDLYRLCSLCRRGNLLPTHTGCFSKATKEHWLARSGYWTNLRADPKNLPLTLHSDVRSGNMGRGGVSKVIFTEILHFTPSRYISKELHICTVNQWRFKNFIIKQMHKYIIRR